MARGKGVRPSEFCPGRRHQFSEERSEFPGASGGKGETKIWIKQDSIGSGGLSLYIQVEGEGLKGERIAIDETQEGGYIMR